MRLTRAAAPRPDMSWVLASIGDSITDAVVGPVTHADAYTALLTDRLTRITTGLNLGSQGDTTGLMYGRRASMIGSGIPGISIIYGGVNDPTYATTVSASPSPTSTVFTVVSNAAMYRAGTQILVNGVAATILSIAGSAFTLTAPLTGGAPAAGAAIAFDTQKNLEAISSYIQGQGCSRVLIAGMHFFNWSTGGDTTSVQMPAQQTMRGLQSAAAANTGARYVDLYAFMRQLILDGVYAQGDDLAWHSAVGNLHLNKTGQIILANAFEASIRSAGWLY